MNAAQKWAQSTDILNTYYSLRAKDYEEVYHRPDVTRCHEQDMIGHIIEQSFKKRYVLELACGTGYWTKYLLRSAQKILASDISDDMLDIANERFATHTNIQLLQGDAYHPPSSVPAFTGAIANFWFSHIPKRNIRSFLSTLHSRLAPSAIVLFVDNVYQKTVGGKLLTKKGSRDTWKRRVLKNGQTFDILKNYYTKEQLLRIFCPYSKNVDIHYLTNFWIVKYEYTRT